MHVNFMHELFESLVGATRAPQVPAASSRQYSVPFPPPAEVRLQRDPPHFLEDIAGQRQLRCRYCNRKVRLQCDQCKQPLCNPRDRDCFKLYHTVPVLPTHEQKATKVSRGRPPAPSPPNLKGTPGRPRKS